MYIFLFHFTETSDSVQPPIDPLATNEQKPGKSLLFKTVFDISCNYNCNVYIFISFLYRNFDSFQPHIDPLATLPGVEQKYLGH